MIPMRFAAGHCRHAAGLAALAREVMLGDHARHRRGHALAHRNVQELVGAMRVGVRTKHAYLRRLLEYAGEEPPLSVSERRSYAR